MNIRLVRVKVGEYLWKFKVDTLELMARDLDNLINHEKNDKNKSYLLVELEVVIKTARKTKRLSVDLKNIVKRHNLK